MRATILMYTILSCACSFGNTTYLLPYSQIVDATVGGKEVRERFSGITPRLVLFDVERNLLSELDSVLGAGLYDPLGWDAEANAFRIRVLDNDRVLFYIIDSTANVIERRGVPLPEPKFPTAEARRSMNLQCTLWMKRGVYAFLDEYEYVGTKSEENEFAGTKYCRNSWLLLYYIHNGSFDCIDSSVLTLSADPIGESIYYIREKCENGLVRRGLYRHDLSSGASVEVDSFRGYSQNGLFYLDYREGEDSLCDVRLFSRNNDEVIGYAHYSNKFKYLTDHGWLGQSFVKQRWYDKSRDADVTMFYDAITNEWCSFDGKVLRAYGSSKNHFIGIKNGNRAVKEYNIPDLPRGVCIQEKDIKTGLGRSPSVTIR